jgi:hypothetical protein
MGMRILDNCRVVKAHQLFKLSHTFAERDADEELAFIAATAKAVYITPNHGSWPAGLVSSESLISTTIAGSVNDISSFCPCSAWSPLKRTIFLRFKGFWCTCRVPTPQSRHYLKLASILDGWRPDRDEEGDPI